MEMTPPSRQKRGNPIDTLFMHLHSLKASDGLLLKIAILVLIVSSLWLFAILSKSSQVEVSSSGGTLREGVVGTPRFINPVLAVTRADRDLVTLVYDGLMKLGPDGALVPNIAESVTVSDDGVTYNVVLRDDVFFHDGEKLTARDVAFTIGRFQDFALASPLRSNFEDVTIEQINDRELNLILAEPYTPFIENLTFGILPEHIWQDATPEEFPFSRHNSEPIGSGPYVVAESKQDTSGIPELYILEPYTGYHGEKANISQIELHFFTNEDAAIEAFTNTVIDSIAGISETRLSELALDESLYKVYRSPLPRTFAIFFNQNRSPALQDLAARQALDITIDREVLVEAALGGYGIPLESPIPPGFGVPSPEHEIATATEDVFEEARAILKDGGWELNEETGVWEKEIDETLTPLAFSISTVNNPVFEKTATFLQTEWEKLGVSVTIKQFEQSDLTQAVIRPRDYEALLFGTVVGRSLDFFSFWHSSQRNDPGLNVALYANITTDSILSEARTNPNIDEREVALIRFAKEIGEEIPAIFLYAPEMLYILPAYVTGTSFTGLAEPQERFASINHWFINTETVWPIFENANQK